MAKPKDALPATDITSTLTLTPEEEKKLRNKQKAAGIPLIGGIWEAQYNRDVANIMAQHQKAIVEHNVDVMIGPNGDPNDPSTWGGQYREALNQYQGTQQQMASMTGSTGGEGSSTAQIIEGTEESAEKDAGEILLEFDKQLREIEFQRKNANWQALGQSIAAPSTEILTFAIDIALLASGLPPVATAATKVSNRGRTLSGGLLSGGGGAGDFMQPN